MTSRALKNQNPAKKESRRAINIGILFNAAAELKSAIELIGHSDPIRFARVVSDELKGQVEPAICNLDSLAETYRAELLSHAIDDAVELLALTTDGRRPPKGQNMVERRDAWLRVRQILELKHWPRDAIDEVIDVAGDLIDEGEFGHLFGDEMPHPLGIPDLPKKSPATGQEAVLVPVICHGCPDEQRPGTENDPRGFPGQLCTDCFISALHDVEAGTVDLAPGWVLTREESGIYTAGPRCEQEAPTADGPCLLQLNHAGPCRWKPEDAA